MSNGHIRPQPAAVADRQAIRMLVAAGYVSEAKANEALQIAHGWTDGELSDAPATPAPVSPEVRFEDYVQAAIASSPAPLRELGEYLTRVLDEDEWPTAESFLLQLATTPAPVAEDAVDAIAIALWHRFAPDDRIEWEDETAKAIYRDAAQQVAALAQDRASQGALYSLDADPAGIRDRAATAITGALVLGSRGDQEPPTGHWLEPFWTMARAEAELRASQGAAAGVPESLIRELCEELESVGCYPCIGSMAGLEDLHGRIAAYLAAAPSAPSAPTQGAEREVGNG